jgi:1-hydroxycarotenoid 3,4-desaturase
MPSTVATGAPAVIVVGAGIAGLAAAIDLARAGLPVRVLERGAGPGGKMRVERVAGVDVDAGPTVLTMRHVFDGLCAAAGTSLDAHVRLTRASVLARHAWNERERLDLHADVDHTEQAIGEFAGAAEARRFRAFCDSARGIYRTLSRTFIEAPRPGPWELARRIGWRRANDLWRIRPFATMWHALGRHFHDPRLRQLFARYSTYCGSSPFSAPATLMLVAHVEQDGVWLVDGGMCRLAQALERIARRLGVEFRYGAHVEAIDLRAGRVRGVRLAGGEACDAAAVVACIDFAALSQGLLGASAQRAVPRLAPEARSLSALTWALFGRPRGFPLSRHNVFFSTDYVREFADLFGRRRPPEEPTVYVCAQDRSDAETPGAGDPERLLCLINAPATGDTDAPDARAIDVFRRRAFDRLAACGLHVEHDAAACVATTPRDFERLFPGSGGALYGPASHGWRASFRRPGARARLPGLYLAGGSVHPGPGVPMAALSGRQAAAAVLARG